MTQDDDLRGFAPLDFFFSEEIEVLPFDQQAKALTKKHLLPLLCKLYGKEHFADVFMGWEPSGLRFQFDVILDGPIAVRYPDFRHADSIELFIDTRANLLAKTTNRFYHHFFFLPERYEGLCSGECTRFRTEDSHPLASEEQLDYTVTMTKKGYRADIFIPKECLVGYDPDKGSRLGFSYRVNRSDGQCQPFAYSYEHARIDSMPSLFVTVGLR